MYQLTINNEKIPGTFRYVSDAWRHLEMKTRNCMPDIFTVFATIESSKEVITITSNNGGITFDNRHIIKQ